MPYLIKSSGGQRSVKLISNKDKVKSQLQEDVIEALRGLTFTLELKVADVFVGESDRAGNSTSAHPSSANDNVPKDQPKFNMRMASKEDSPVKDQVEADKPSDGGDDRPKPRPHLPKETQFLIHPAIKAYYDQREQQVLIKGDLKVGSTFDTICVNAGGTDDSPTAFVTYDEEKLVDVTNKIQEIAIEIESRRSPRCVEVGDIVYAKSKEDNSWYRAMVTSYDDGDVEVNYFDWGLNEYVDLSQTRRLTDISLGTSKYPACAIQVKFSDKSNHLVGEVLRCDRRFKAKVESFDSSDKSYTITILQLLDP